MNSLWECQTKIIDITGCDCPMARFREFIYLVPVPTQPQPTSLEGKSLEEIREIYGDQKAQEVYTLAVHGIDATKSKLTFPSFPVRELIDVKICTKENRRGDFTVSVYLSKKYGKADEARLFSLKFALEVGKEEREAIVQTMTEQILQGMK